MTFGQWLRNTRKGLMLSQEECSERAGVSQSVWSDYEKGADRALRRDTVEKIADALGVSRKEALAAAGYQTDPASESLLRAEIEAICDRVPPARQAGFLRAVRSMADAVSA